MSWFVGAETLTIFSTVRAGRAGSTAWPACSRMVALSAMCTWVSTSELLLSARAGVGSSTRVVLVSGGGSTMTYATPAASPTRAVAASNATCGDAASPQSTSKVGHLVTHGSSSSVTRRIEDEAIPRPTNEVAGTRLPKRGEYQPAIGSTSARWTVQRASR